MGKGNTRGITRLLSLLLVLCLLLPGPAARAVEEEPENEGDASLLSRTDEYGFYIGDPNSGTAATPDNWNSFFVSKEGTDGSWSYTYNKSDSQFPFTLTLKNNFRHSFAVFNDPKAPEQLRFRIVVEGSAAFTYWEMDQDVEGTFYESSWPVYVYGGSLTIQEFSGGRGGDLGCALLAAEGAHIYLPNGVFLNGGSLWAQGGTISVTRGMREDNALYGVNGYQLYCYVDDGYPESWITIDGQGKPAASFNIGTNYDYGYEETPTGSGDKLSVGLELENTKLEDESGQRLYLGSEAVNSLCIFNAQMQQAEYVRVSNSKTELPDKNKSLTITFTDGEGHSFTETAQTGKMMVLPLYKLDTTPNGKKFKAWRIPDVRYGEIKPDESAALCERSWMFSADTTVEAVWTDERPTEVNFDVNGGIGYTQIMTAQNGKLPSLPKYPCRAGYDFTGWFTEKEGGTEFSLDMEFWGEEPVTFYARWTEQSTGRGRIHGTGISWTMENGTLTLEGGGAVPEMLEMAAPWYPDGVNSEGLKVISIGPGITALPERPFNSARSLERVEVDGDSTAFKSIEGVLYSADLTQMLLYPPQKKSEVLIVPSATNRMDLRSVGNCHNLKSIQVESGNSVYYTQDGILFAHDQELQGDVLCLCPRSVRLPAVYTVPAGIRRIEDNALFNQVNLEEVVFPEGLASIGMSAFGRCIKLRSLHLPRSLQTIENQAFWSCAALTEAVLPESLQTIGSRAFSECGALGRVTLPESLQTIDSYAFDGCTGLTELEFPAGLQTIGNGAFSGCTGLTEALLPESLQFLGNSAFSGCTGISQVRIPTSLTRCGAEVFSGCTALEGIVIPDGVYAGRMMLNQCSSLRWAVLGDRCRNPDMVFGDSAPELRVLVLPMGASFSGSFSRMFPRLERLYCRQPGEYWKSWGIPDTVEVVTGSWGGVVTVEDLGETARITLYDSISDPYRYSPDIPPHTLILAAYDSNGRQMCVRTWERMTRNGVMELELPVSLAQCGRIAVYGIRPEHGVEYGPPVYAPIAAATSWTPRS